MAVVWVAGCSSYETTGVIHLLRGYGSQRGAFQAGRTAPDQRHADTLFQQCTFAGVVAVSEDNTMGDASL